MKSDDLVLTYERVSTEEQTHTKSCDDQKAINDRYIFQQGWSLAENGDYRDEGISGKLSERPGLQDLLIRCKDDPQIKAVIVSEADRIARGNQAFIFIRETLKSHEVKIISVTQPMINDTDEGEMFGEIMGAINGYFASITRRKSMRALDEKAIRGWWPSKAPLGYKNVNVGTEDSPERIIEINEDEAVYIRQIPYLYNNGKSYREIADFFYELGLRGHENGKVSANEIRYILSNDFYLGEFKWRGKKYKGKHPPLFSRTEVIQARNRSHEIGHSHTTNKLKDKFPFKTIPNFLCATDLLKITAEHKVKFYKRTNRTAEYDLYHCTKSKGGWKKCKQPSINKKDLILEFAEKAVAPIEIDRDLADFLFEEMDNQAAYDMQEKEKLLHSISKRLGQLENELHKLFDAYIGEKIVSIGERTAEQVYDEFKLRKEIERDTLLKRKKLILEDSDEWKEKASNFFSLCVDAKNRFLNATEEKQANFLRTITSNVLLDNKQLVVTHQFPFSVLIKSSDRTNLLRG